MNLKEAELVNINFIKEDTNYNICVGGQGGWSYVNSNRSEEEKFRISILGTSAALKARNPEKAIINSKKGGNNLFNNKLGIFSDEYKLKNPIGPFTNKQHTKEAKLNIGMKSSINQMGEGNSQYGTMWITNGLISKKIRKEDIIPDGWYKGYIRKSNKI